MEDLELPDLTRQLGGWLMIPDPLVVESAGRAGFDWVGLDLQHGVWDLERAFRGIQLLDALGVPTAVRIAEEELPIMPRLLDHGVERVVIAMVTSASSVTHAIDGARYQPQGRRSYGGQRYGLRAEPSDVGDVAPLIYAMIEDIRGVARVEDIAAVPGLAGLHVGPVDLGLGMGLGMNRAGKAWDQALAHIRNVGHDATLPVTMHAVRGWDAKHWFEAGWDEVVLPADMDLLRGAFEDHISAARESASTSGDRLYGRRHNRTT